MKFRAENPEDIDHIRNVNIAAFGRVNEAKLVDRLRGMPSTFSFVAFQADRLVGHVFFSPITIAGKSVTNLFLLGLAPVAILPEYQRQGIGSLLVQYGLEKCDRLGCKAVVVLGHPEYYPRFGFVPAKKHGLQCEYDVPDEAFMVLELENGALLNCSGTVKYRPEFSECE